MSISVDQVGRRCLMSLADIRRGWQVVAAADAVVRLAAGDAQSRVGSVLDAAQ